MNKNKVYTYVIIISAVAIITTYLLTRKKKNMEIIVSGEYTVPKNVPNRVDALHSFESRKSDGFGGKMSTKIKDALLKLYQQGINPDVTDLKVNVDTINYKVTWQAKVEPSKDGKAYLGFMTFGSAGSNSDKRAIDQTDSMKQKKGGSDYNLVLDFKNVTNIPIRQFFYKYTKPNDFPFH